MSRSKKTMPAPVEEPVEAPAAAPPVEASPSGLRPFRVCRPMVITKPIADLRDPGRMTMSAEPGHVIDQSHLSPDQSAEALVEAGVLAELAPGSNGHLAWQAGVADARTAITPPIEAPAVVAVEAPPKPKRWTARHLVDPGGVSFMPGETISEDQLAGVDISRLERLGAIAPIVE